jgi:RNA polymerase-binding transcription factor DksA
VDVLQFAGGLALGCIPMVHSHQNVLPGLGPGIHEIPARRTPQLADGRAVEMGDIAAISFEKEIVFGQNASTFYHLRLSEEALKRISAGTFGYCELCESEIGLQRLGAVPWTPYCVGCQEQLERS